MRCRRNDHGGLAGGQPLADEAGDGAASEGLLRRSRRRGTTALGGPPAQVRSPCRACAPPPKRPARTRPWRSMRHRARWRRRSGAGRKVPDEGAGLESVEAGHRDVQDDQIGMQRASGVDSRLAIRDRGDHVEVGASRVTIARPRLVVIVRHHDARPGHVAAILRHGGQGHFLNAAQHFTPRTRLSV